MKHPHPRDRRPMEEVVKGLRAKARKIHALAAEGYSTSEIASFLDVTSQSVGDVLTGPKTKAAGGNDPGEGHPPRSLRGGDGATMDTLVANMKSKSDKIRALGQAGYTPARIAQYLGIRYQHAYNVLKQAERAGWPTFGKKVGLAKLGRDGRFVIPATFRKAMGIEPGDDLILHSEDGELRVVGRRVGLERARAIVRRFVPEGVSLVDELIADRRAEAARESAR